ncbi:hypothetical protein SKAU_G00392170 [Synaphobranchus kaupii]|uniref:Uncharacterized protein n=1 Tax=Synaphobranchus kaupii TaxID=118154 RepID=A0A9Q1EBP8_SYNKA|nr:hypothetical protein SKAU_G00392170 [Synaphobranchus kaupii]
MPTRPFLSFGEVGEASFGEVLLRFWTTNGMLNEIAPGTAFGSCVCDGIQALMTLPCPPLFLCGFDLQRQTPETIAG